MDGGLSYTAGDPIAWFSAKTISGDTVDIHVDAGRYVLLGFLGTPAPASEPFDAKLGELLCHRPRFKEDSMVCYGILAAPPPPGSLYWLIDNPALMFLADYDGALAARFGLGDTYGTVILDPLLRIIDFIPQDAPGGHALALSMALGALPPLDRYLERQAHPPILVVPRALDLGFCADLVAYYNAEGGVDSGFMLDRGGVTSTVTNHALKRRSDVVIRDPELVTRLRSYLVRRILPEVEKAFSFKATRMDRYLVTHYPSDGGGHFFRHRDNLNAGARHRRFALSINLNDPQTDFEGGAVRFPEYSATRYRAAAGTAVVFSCGLLHEVTAVTAGERYTFVAFLYGEEDAAIRAQNNANLAVGERVYHEDDRLFPAAEADADTGSDAVAPLSTPLPAASAAPPPQSTGGEDWLPVRADMDGRGMPSIEWLDMGGQDLAAPFFSQSVQARLLAAPDAARRHTALTALGEGDSLPLQGMIFHLSRCGSTLVTQMLATLDSTLVLSEPDPLNDLLGPAWSGVPDGVRQDIVSAMMASLTKKRGAAQTGALVKLSSWNTIFGALLPESLGALPRVFVYRDPLEVMVSLLAEPPTWMDLKADPMIASWLTGCPPAMIGWMGREEYCARVLARILSAVWNSRERRWLLVNYSELPGAVIDRIAAHLGLTPTTEQTQRMMAATRVHAKDPSRQRPFSADGAAKRSAVTDAIAKATEDHLLPVYERIEALRKVQMEFASGVNR